MNTITIKNNGCTQLLLRIAVVSKEVNPNFYEDLLVNKEWIIGDTLELFFYIPSTVRKDLNETILTTPWNTTKHGHDLLRGVFQG